MTLDEYMTDNNIENIAAARQLKITKWQVGRLRNLQCEPRAKTFQRIVKWSGGKITAADMYGVKKR